MEPHMQNVGIDKKIDLIIFENLTLMKKCLLPNKSQIRNTFVRM